MCAFIAIRYYILIYYNHNDNSLFFLACVSSIVECGKVEYDTERVDHNAYIDKCIPEQWRGFSET